MDCYKRSYLTNYFTIDLALNHGISRPSISKILKKIIRYKNCQTMIWRWIECYERLMDFCNIDEHFAGNEDSHFFLSLVFVYKERIYASPRFTYKWKKNVLKYYWWSVMVILLEHLKKRVILHWLASWKKSCNIFSNHYQTTFQILNKTGLVNNLPKTGEPWIATNEVIRQIISQ